MSSGSNFLDAMLNGVCNQDADIGDSVSPGTGFGGSISNVFDQVGSQARQKNMTFAVVTPFSNGNTAPVSILEFINVDLISQSGSGGNWSGTFKLVARNVTPPVGGGSGAPTRRYLQSLS